MKGFVVTLLLLVLILFTSFGLVSHYRRQVDAFLNSDEPVETKRVVTSGPVPAETPTVAHAAASPAAMRETIAAR